MTPLRHLLIVVMGTVLALPACALTLTLKANATPSRGYVALEDVAEISGLRPGTTLDGLRRMRVASFPMPEQELRFSRKLLTTRLRYAYPSLTGTLEWRGADAAVVSIASQSVAPAQLQAVAESALREALSPLLGQARLSVSDPLPPLVVPTGELRLTADPVNTAMLSRRMNVGIEMTVGEQYRRKITIWFDVSGQVAAPVARADIGAGTRLAESMFTRQLVEIGSVRAPLLYDSIPFSQMRTRHPVLAGTTLTRTDIASAPTISRQHEVTVQVIGNGITIEISGVALSDAELGKPVRIRNPRSGDDFVAQAIGPDIAQITVR